VLRGVAGNRVDRGRLQLGQVDVAALRGGPLDVGGQRRAPRQVRGGHHRLDALAAWRAGREQRHPRTVRQRLDRLAAQRKAQRLGWRDGVLVGQQQLCPQQRVLAQRLRLARSDHADGAIHLHRRDARSGAFEQKRLRARKRRRQLRASRHVRLHRRSGEPPAHAPAAHGPHPRQHRVLEVVRGGVRASGRYLEQIREPDVGGGHARLGRPAPPHAHDHRIDAALAQQRRPVPGHRGLAGALAGADHGQLHTVEGDRRVARRVESQTRCLVAQPEVQGQRRQAQLRARRQHRLVGEVHDRLGGGRQSPQRLLRAGLDPPPVDLLERAGGKLLLTAAEDHAREVEPLQRVTHRLRMVLAVDERDDRHAGRLSRAPSRPAATGPSRTRTCAGRTR
jgi:hypothetical protein